MGIGANQMHSTETFALLPELEGAGVKAAATPNAAPPAAAGGTGAPPAGDIQPHLAPQRVKRLTPLLAPESLPGFCGGLPGGGCQSVAVSKVRRLGLLILCCATHLDTDDTAN